MFKALYRYRSKQMMGKVTAFKYISVLLNNKNEEQRAESTRASKADFERFRPRYDDDDEDSPSYHSREGLFYISRQTNEVPGDGFVEQNNCEVTPQINKTSSIRTNVPSRVPLFVPHKSAPNKMAKREPDKFDGKSVDWQDYIVHFEQTAKWNDWDDESKAQQLCMCLRGTAQKLLGGAKSNVLADYTSLKDMLSRRFAPKERITAYRCEFNSRIRRKSESIQDYGYALQRLLSKRIEEINKTIPLQCTKCKRLGNVIKDCRVPTCYNCQKVGHVSKDCKAPKSNRKQNNSNQDLNKESLSSGSETQGVDQE
ncbi:unnamed protein product [Mytilus coruscus]|uniref:CCHC-type domain-containing protein n=1 Tax=Mytilus coruscus TaxID=42192 RepID=A0A6J8B5K5_MYTCO|nr:unnamed protein product [Mytilus coruscus]